MKLLRYGPKGQERPGILDGSGRVRDLGGVVRDIDPAGLVSIQAIRALDPAELPLVDDPGRIGACVGRVGKFICVGLNYADHAAESGMPVPDEPILFMKATSAIAGPNDDITIPPGSEKTDWEVELGVVIGREVSYVDEIEAADAIAGYCVVNDLSERRYQLERGGQWVKGKSCPGFGPIGPWLVTADEVTNPDNLRMWLEVDGTRVQDGSTATMIFRPAFLVSYVSQFMSLQPGDVISTGTPPGVGMGQTPPRYLRPGQTIRLGIECLGEQSQRTVAYAPPGSTRPGPI